MAQQDTGLGWSAKSEWLTSPSGAIAAIVTGGVTDPVPVNNTAYTTAEAVTLLYPQGVYYREYPSEDPVYPLLFSQDIANFPDIGAFIYIDVPYAYIIYVAETDPSSNGFVGVAAYKGNPATQLFSSSGSNTWAYNASSGLYYRQSSLPNASFTPGTLPIFTSVQDGLDTFVSSRKLVYKLQSGPAVVCAAEWVTPEGTTLISPVLISTVPNATIMSYDAQTPAPELTTFNFVLDGLVFYMSLIGGNFEPVETTYEYANLVQFAAAEPVKVFRLLAGSSFANILVTDAVDPYNGEGGGSGEEGGGGDTDPEDDPVEEETLPIPAVSGLGFSTIYVPTAYDLYQLASYLWGGNLDLDNFLRLFANPMDSILGLSAVPVALSGTYEPIYLGGQLLQGVTMPRYSGRTAVKVDMGSVSISERWGSYLDYDPYTEFSVYLPFIGIKNIKADDVMGKTVSLMYNIDILSGACVAYLRTSGGSVLYEWAGQCAMQIPITGSNWDNIFSTAISTAVTLGGAMVAPASAPMLAGSVASAAVQAVAAKPRVERSGAVTGVTGFLGQLRPYIIRTIPEAYIPNDQNKFIGYPSYISASLGSLTGYNEVASIHLENIPATGDELSELESILKGGVIF